MEYIKECSLCPRKCRVLRSAGDKGFCGMSDRIKIARAALHYWEEPCISGKRGSGAVFFSGCNLGCIYCQNYDISVRKKGIYVSSSELSDIFLELQSKGAHNINLVTATHFIPWVIEALEKAKDAGLRLPIIYNCGGYESVSSLRMLEGLIDVYLPDFKYYNNKYALEYSSVCDYSERVREAVEEMFRQAGKARFDSEGMIVKGVIVRHLMLPGLLFDSKKVIDYLYNTYNDDIWISIMNQYTPLKQVKGIKNLDRTLNKKHYAALVDYAAGIGVKNAFVQGEGASGEKFIPEFYDENQKE